MADDIMTFDEILEDPTYKSEFDRRVTKALSTVQAKLDAEIKKSSGMKSSEDFSALEEELNKSKTELGKLKQEKYVLSKGLTGEEAEFIAFKAGKMVDDKTTFEQAVDALTADRKKTSFDWTAPVGGGTQKTGENDVMNALIRGALK
ncbi:MAG: hypothetical protein KH119_13750 [Faecalibacterium prausnitzii]|jgi:hypothetical protein|uniref:hypothetical protein n=1 Tax=Collinsella sp. TaxID=1965294 RepID=UPI00205FA063|nr:hypothetical protein [Collinsella sp.]MBS7060211.1 hypothetical protein [Faecalibacterium prausnitzii]MEE0703068.1 hypothetical protein [Collinsella sp.]DAX25430.1 MAG TPA: hypothetical protein [Caudoviricetes sp.]